MMDNFFNADLFFMSSEGFRSVVPYLILCAGVAIATVGAAYRHPVRLFKLSSVFVFVPLFYFLCKGLALPEFDFFGSSLKISTGTLSIALGVSVMAFLSILFKKEEENVQNSEWAVMFFVCALGMSLLAGARNWTAFFVYLETLSMPAYLLACVNSKRKYSLEAGVKYLMVGAFASAILLMGLSLLYGVAGSLDFELVSSALFKTTGTNVNIAYIAVTFVLAGIAFKMALIPFHMWAPDVYGGAPSSSAAFLASATKFSVFGAAFYAFHLSGFYELLVTPWFFSIVGILTVIVASFVAMGQRSLRRLFAFSGIVNAGYVALAFSHEGASLGTMLFFLFVYGVSVIACFALIQNICQFLGKDSSYDLKISELAELNKRAPWYYSFFVSVFFLSLAGIPPLPGFFTKYYLLADIWAQGGYWHVAVILLSTLMGLGYYLKVISTLYFNASAKADDELTLQKPQLASRQISFWPVVSVGMIALLMGALIVNFEKIDRWTQLVDLYLR